MEVQRPPIPPPIEQFRIIKERAIEITKEARQKLFDTEKGKTYHEIYSKAYIGGYSIEYVYPENCNYEDIINLKNELIAQGYKVEFQSGIHDRLKISWYK